LIIYKNYSSGTKETRFRGASLNTQTGKYAKYWLLNAKETNKNGWGINPSTAGENMQKFIGRPLVVTSNEWHEGSEYGAEYEHPYLPTDDIQAILRHQENYRVGTIVGVEKDDAGDWFARIEMMDKFADMSLPPFCSPAIYQLDGSESEGNISKWEALHLAALDENPAYGARIALLKGTCTGTNSECKTQLKVAKTPEVPEPTEEEIKLNIITQLTAKLRARLASLGEQNMTYQDSKPIKIISEKHPEVRKPVDASVDVPEGSHEMPDGTIMEDTDHGPCLKVAKKELKMKLDNMTRKQVFKQVLSRLKDD
jgi:hypothetical protein